MKKRRIVVSIFALAILTVLAFYAWPRIKRLGTKTQPSIKTAAILRGDITQLVTANGQLKAVKTVTVGSQLSGIITEIFVDFNDRVTNGQVIAQIDPSNARQQLLEAEAQLSNARAALDLATLNLQRARELMKAKLISKADFDKSETEWRQAEAVVRSRDAAVNRVKVDLSHATIYSPIDGIVISRAVDIGQTVAASLNAPTLFTIAQDLSKMRIEANVSEADVGGVEKDQRVTFTVDAFPDLRFSGLVTQVRYEPIINQNVVNYVAIVDVDNEGLRLRPGMTANASIVTAKRRDALRIPNSALRFRPPEGIVILPAPGVSGEASAKSGVAGEASAKPGVSGEASAKPDVAASALPTNDPSLHAINSNATTGVAGERRRGNKGSGRTSTNGDSENRTVYLVQTNDQGIALTPVPVKTGITDGAWTEAVDGLKEGDTIATGLNSAQAKPAATATTSPFAPTPPMGRRH